MLPGQMELIAKKRRQNIFTTRDIAPAALSEYSRKSMGLNM
jgi:hypothetical protein